jgi:hypothetical protein
VLLFWLSEQGVKVGPIAAAAAGPGRFYTTDFANTENPISEDGKWVNGRMSALDWTDVRIAAGLAFGTETGTTKYDDSTALLTGAWAPDQTVEATVFSVKPDDHIYEEVELRLRSSLAAHRATGYEINFRCSKSNSAYAEIVRWNGPLGSFTYLTRGKGSQFGVKTGDVVRATMIGNIITAYINNREVLRASDDSFTTGSPGMGFYLQGRAGMNHDFGFTHFRATDRAVAGSHAQAAGARQIPYGAAGH